MLHFSHFFNNIHFSTWYSFPNHLLVLIIKKVTYNYPDTFTLNISVSKMSTNQSRREIVEINRNYSSRKNFRSQLRTRCAGLVSQRDSFISPDRIFYLSFDRDQGGGGGKRRTRQRERESANSALARAAIVAGALSARFPQKLNIDIARVLADGKPSNFPASQFANATQIREQPVEDDATTRNVLATIVVHRSRLPSCDVRQLLFAIDAQFWGIWIISLFASLFRGGYTVSITARTCRVYCCR